MSLMYERITHMHEDVIEGKVRYFFLRKVTDKEFLFTCFTCQPNKDIDIFAKSFSE